MYLLGARFLLLSAMATVASAHKCSGYFCDKAMYDIHIVMTHNSLAYKNGPGRCQTYNLVKQFQDGVRGFNFDLYPCPPNSDSIANTPCGTIWHEHGIGSQNAQSYDPAIAIRGLANELRKDKYRNEIIVIQLQNRLDTTEMDYFEGLFGDLLMKQRNLNSGATLTDDIEMNERVFIENGGSWPKIGENDYKWNRCRSRDMPVSCRSDRASKCTADWQFPILLMNSFCSGWSNLRNNAKYTNKRCRLLENARRFATSGNFESFPSTIDDDIYDGDYPNVLMVDFYEEGDVFGAQDCLRAEYFGSCVQERC